ncbi:MAG: DJ-1/PfpI family protein [Eubacteriales bacterium]|jgi:4-methyl-5(b-hydroxyethyl)-thiazole monophosphate biosynthesis|nr:DJ-1/PfpI family protein [Eubacteriales bacterium]
MSRAVVFLADGFEEVEALTVVDLLRRAGIEVVTVSISDSLTLVGRSHIEVGADVMFGDLQHPEQADMFILPGGQPGTTYLGEHEGVAKTLAAANEAKKYICAICAAPTVLAKQGYLKGRKAACYPGLENVLEENGAEPVTDEEVVKDGRFITSRGVGTAIPFALKLIKVLAGEDRAREIGRSIVYKAE